VAEESGGGGGAKADGDEGDWFLGLFKKNKQNV